MKKLVRAIFFVLAACTSTIVFAQNSNQELLRQIEASNRAARLEMEKDRLKWEKMEADTTRHHAEIKRLRMLNESEEVADRAREMADRAELAESEQARTAKKAKEAAEELEEAAAELRDEMAQAAVSAKNNIYLGVLLLLTAVFVTYITRESKKEDVMQESQKFGIATIIGSALVIIFAVTISDGWVYKIDFLQNIMSSLRIRLFEGEINPVTYSIDYYVDIPTKYIVLACICAAAYGLTTYLGITPVPKKKVL